MCSPHLTKAAMMASQAPRNEKKNTFWSSSLLPSLSLRLRGPSLGWHSSASRGPCKRLLTLPRSYLDVLPSCCWKVRLACFVSLYPQWAEYLLVHWRSEGRKEGIAKWMNVLRAWPNICLKIFQAGFGGGRHMTLHIQPVSVTVIWFLAHIWRGRLEG